MKDYNVLIAEDDKDIVEILKLYLLKEFNVSTASNGEEALEILKSGEIDIALIDIMMPIMDGNELLKYIRKNSNIPVIIISAKNKIEDKINGIDNGADIYITKPFDPREVVATIKSMIRRCYKYKEKNRIIKIGDLELNGSNYILRKNGKKIDLTSIEFRIMSKMMRDANRTFTREELYECIGDTYINVDSDTIMVHISNIRNKLKAVDSIVHIKTIRKVGYKIEEE